MRLFSRTPPSLPRSGRPEPRTLPALASSRRRVRVPHSAAVSDNITYAENPSHTETCTGKFPGVSDNITSGCWSEFRVFRLPRLRWTCFPGIKHSSLRVPHWYAVSDNINWSTSRPRQETLDPLSAVASNEGGWTVAPGFPRLNKVKLGKTSPNRLRGF
jgi:hypothetical protein